MFCLVFFLNNHNVSTSFWGKHTLGEQMNILKSVFLSSRFRS